MRKFIMKSLPVSIISIALLVLSYNVNAQTFIEGPTAVCYSDNQTPSAYYSFGDGAETSFVDWDISPFPGTTYNNSTFSAENLGSTYVYFGGPGTYSLTAHYIDASPDNNPVTHNYSITIQVAQLQTTIGNVTGGGTFCFNDPTAGATITLSQADTAYVYYLIHDGIRFSPQKTSTAGSMTWSHVRQTGTIRVISSNAFCYRFMNGYAAVNTIDYATPTPYPVTGGGTFCEGGGGYVTVLQSEPSMSYTLMSCPSGTSTSCTAVGGFSPQGRSDKRSITFGAINTAGIYRVKAVYTGSDACGPIVETYMDGAATIAFNALPDVSLNTLSGTNYCSGINKGTATITNAQAGLKYQLLNNGVPEGDVFSAGGGNTWTGLTAGRYSVSVTNETTTCTNYFGNILIEDLLPDEYSVTGTKTLCGGTTATINLDHSELNVTYQLYKDAALVASSLKNGLDGGALQWTGITAPGEYTVIATGSVSGCNQPMKGSAKVSVGPSATISMSRYFCTNNFTATIAQLGTCGITSFLWNFGDGTTSTRPDPFHNYASNGTYTVSVQITTKCDDGGIDCTITATAPVTITPYVFDPVVVDVVTDRRLKIINTSSATFSDSWQLPYEAANLSDLNPFVSGERGVWRNNAQYTYRALREQSPTINIATDGTYPIDFFSWDQSAAEALPDWIKSTSITRYGAYSFELENRDALEIPSAVLYDYNGQLLTAEGSNMRNEEMAFTSFEEASPATSGNWTLNSQQAQIFKNFKVVYGKGHQAVVEAPLSEFTGITEVDVFGYRWVPFNLSFLGYNNTNFLTKVPIACAQADPDPTYSAVRTVLVLDEAPFAGVWQGVVAIRKIEGVTLTSTTDTQVHHTGLRSLKLTTEQTFPQKQIKLEKDQRYSISLWASVNNPSIETPQLGSNIGVQVIIKDKDGVPQPAIDPFVPEGPIVEGWQQIKGSFPVSIADAKLEIKLLSPGSVWYDDLRFHPEDGMMKSYVYDAKDNRLVSILDEDNFASLFYYDVEGNLIITKKETERGIKTISENVTFTRKN